MIGSHGYSRPPADASNHASGISAQFARVEGDRRPFRLVLFSSTYFYRKRRKVQGNVVELEFITGRKRTLRPPDTFAQIGKQLRIRMVALSQRRAVQPDFNLRPAAFLQRFEAEPCALHELFGGIITDDQGEASLIRSRKAGVFRSIVEVHAVRFGLRLQKGLSVTPTNAESAAFRIAAGAKPE